MSKSEADHADGVIVISAGVKVPFHGLGIGGFDVAIDGLHIKIIAEQDQTTIAKLHVRCLF